MAKSQQHSAVLSPIHRPNDGALVDIVQNFAVGTNGQTGTNFSINLAIAPVPDRKYVADVASVLYSRETVKLIFGQEKMNAADLRSLLIIQMNVLSATLFIKSLVSMQNPSLDEISNKLKLSDKLYDVTKEPDQTVALAANMVAVGISGRDTDMDFYQVSPFSAAVIARNKGKQIPVEPVVRVNIRTSLLVAIYRKLCEIQKDFPSES